MIFDAVLADLRRRHAAPLQHQRWTEHSPLLPDRQGSAGALSTWPIGLAISAILVLGAPAAHGQDRAELVGMAERLEAYADQLSRVWPGYWPPDQPYILYAPDTGAVFGGAASPQGPSFRPGPLAGVTSTFATDFPTGAPDTVLLTLSGRDDDLSTLFHEQFHDFQEDRFRWQGESGSEHVDLSLIGDLEAFTFGVELELRLLADILVEDDAATRRELARAYLALRRERERGMDALVVSTERHREWTEGTAEYAGRQASALFTGRSDEQLRDDLVSMLRRDLLFRPGDYAANVFRWRLYATGAALAWLLDDLEVPDWRTAIEGGTPLDLALEQAIGLADPVSAADVRASYDARDIRAAIARPVDLARSAGLDASSFLAQAPARLVIELEVSLDDPEPGELYFNAPAMTPLSRDTLALPDAEWLSINAGSSSLRVERRSILIEMPPPEGSGPSIQRVSILLPSLSGLEGLRPGRLEAAVEVDMEGLTLRLAAGAIVEVNDTTITVRVR